MTLEKYVFKMRHSHVWGGAIEIKAFADMFHKNIKLLSVPNRKTIEFLSNNPDRSPWIQLRWNGRHYDPILR